MTARQVLREAFLKTILKVGMRRFKETSLFGSNDRDQTHDNTKPPT